MAHYGYTDAHNGIDYELAAMRASSLTLEDARDYLDGYSAGISGVILDTLDTWES